MKLLKIKLLILVVFFKTGNLLSDNNLFNVNNIVLEKKENISNQQLANKAIKKAFNQLLIRVLLSEDLSKVSDLKLSEIKELVAYYNISKNSEEEINSVIFNITFNKEKIHDLFYKKNISYSDISDKEFYILPILINKNDIFIFSNNYYYENWNTFKKGDLIEFILPLENIEIIQNINKYKNNLLDLDLSLLLKEYQNKNKALVLIEKNNLGEKKIYLKMVVQEKNITRNLKFKKDKLQENIIVEVKNQITNLIKSQNLIDIRTPSFLNVKLNLSKKSNLVIFNSKIKEIDLIENIFVQEFNKDNVYLKIKYLGKLEKIIIELKNKNIDLQLVNDQWMIKTL